VPSRDDLCRAGHQPGECCDTVRAGLRDGQGGGKHKWICPAHDDVRPSLSVNVGTKGMRLVWNCKAGCSEEDVRAALLGLGIDESCLGTYGVPRTRSRNDSAPSRGTDPVALADARRWHAVTKLPDLNGSLLRMCIQAISETSSSISSDPLELLPVTNRDDFVALAGRAGLDSKYRYKLYERWLREVEKRAA
jgi:hypothetical protein